MRYLIPLIVPFFLLACSKEYNPPEVETVSVAVAEEGILEITGRVIEDYGHIVSYSGFCLSTLTTTPEMRNSQILYGETEGEFNALIPYTEEGVDIYVRTFAANDYGYNYGNVLKFTTPDFLSPEVPCNVPVDTIECNCFNYPNITSFALWNADTNRGSLSSGVIRLDITGQGNSPNIYFELNRMPRNGVYDIVGDTRFREGYRNEVSATVHDFSLYRVLEGQLYITETEDNKLRFEFCDLIYKTDPYELKISGSVEI